VPQPRTTCMTATTTAALEAAMRVKLCARCPYTPRDLADHYDPEAAAHLCASCDGEQGKLRMYYPREARRRRTCSIAHNTFGTAQRSAAPSVTESLVSPSELHSVQRSALIASRPAGRPTADGCADLKLPDDSYREKHAEISCRSGLRNEEAAH
jgi:hypothetical protein